MLRESEFSHFTSTFCVRKQSGKYSIVHAYDKLNAAFISAQTPFSRYDELQKAMVGWNTLSALDLIDSYCQVFVRASDTAYSGMQYERYVLGMTRDA